MKLRYLFTAVLSTVLLAVGCTEKYEITSLDEIQLSSTHICIPAEGGDVKVELTAKTSWEFAKVINSGNKDDNNKPIYLQLPEWLTVSALEGGEGTTTLTFHAEKDKAGRETALVILAGGKQQNLIVRQGEVKASEATCKDVIEGPDGKSYIVEGVVTSIANTTYGNWYLDDGTGEIYIYGTLDSNGGEKNFASLGIEVGDVVKVKGPKTTYGSTIELVNVSVLKITKSLIGVVDSEVSVGVEGGEVAVRLVNKGSTILASVPDEAKDWLTLSSIDLIKGVPTEKEKNPADTTCIRYIAAPSTLVEARTANLKFSTTSGDASSEITVVLTQKGNEPEKSDIKYALAGGPGATVNVQGRIAAICNQGYVLADKTGAILVYYGKSFTAADYKIGTEYKAVGKTSAYNFAPQFDNGKGNLYLESKIKDGSFTYGTPVAYDKAKIEALQVELLPDVSKKDEIFAVDIQYVKLTGTVKVDGNYCNLIFTDTEAMQGSFYQLTDAQKTSVVALDGKKVELYGYMTSVSVQSKTTPKFINVVMTEIKEVE